MRPIAQPVRTVTVPARARLPLIRSEAGTWVYLVEEGLLRPVAIAPDGRECGLGLVGTGEAFLHGEVEGRPAIGLYVQAVRDSRCLYSRREDLPALARADPDLAGRLLSALAGRAADLAALSASLVLDSARDRLVRQLHLLARRHGTPDAGRLMVRLRQQDLAIMAGVCRETVNATLRDLERRGTVRCGRQTVWVSPEA